MFNMIFTKSKPANLTKNDERLVYILHTLGDKTRFKIFKILLVKKDLCVSDIAAELRISVPAVSQHFKTFELVGLVEKERMGQKICYHLKNDDKMVNQLVKIAKKK